MTTGTAAPQHQREPMDAAVVETYALATVALASDSLVPAARGGATLTQVDEDGGVYLIGGATRDAQCFNDVHRFDMATRAWTRVTPTSGSASFAARSGHSAVAFGHRIVVFGGLDLGAGVVLNDVHIFDTRTHCWTTPAIADGEVPLPRNAHAAVVLPRAAQSTALTSPANRMLVFGGSSPVDGAMDDVFVLVLPPIDSTEPLKWERIEHIRGESPEARELHCATLLPSLSPANSSVSVSDSDSDANLICFSGGRNAAGTICTDMALLDTRNWRWTLVPICEWNRCSHVAACVDNAVVSFGGFDGAALRSDCFVYADAAETWLRVELLMDQHSDNCDSAILPAKPADLARFGHAGCAVTLPTTWFEPLQPTATAAVATSHGAATRHALLVFGGMTASCDLNDLVVITQQLQLQI